MGKFVVKVPELNNLKLTVVSNDASCIYATPKPGMDPGYNNTITSGFESKLNHVYVVTLYTYGDTWTQGDTNPEYVSAVSYIFSKSDFTNAKFRMMSMITKYANIEPYASYEDMDMIAGPVKIGYLGYDSMPTVKTTPGGVNYYYLSTGPGWGVYTPSRFINYTFYNCTKINLTSYEFYRQFMNGGDYYRVTLPGIIAKAIYDAGLETFDPYNDAGTAAPGGGDKDFDDSSVNIDFPSVPTVSAIDTGFITAYNPTLAEVQSLSSYMWGPLFDISTVKKMFANPMDAILGLSIIPVPVSVEDTQTNVKVAGVSTGVNMYKITDQFVDVDLGTLNIKTGTGGSYLDYSPYTHAQIFIPYVGFRDINIDDIMDKTISLKMRVDILSGGCVAFLKCGGSILYEFTGHCAVEIPITSNDFSSIVRSAMGVVGAGIGFALGGPAGAALGLSGTSSAVSAGDLVSAGSSIAGNVMGAKSGVARSGSLAGASGVLGHQFAFIVLTRPDVQRPSSQIEMMGYPSYITYKVSELIGTGFNSFSTIKLEGLGFTEAEMNELEDLMKEGVYL